MAGKPRHGMSYAPEYQVYQTAKDRCTNPKSQRWKSHGARGIQFLFDSFEHFYLALGPRPPGDYSLERINNDGNYESGNVKWATRSEQQLNKRPYTTLKRHGKGYAWSKKSQKWQAGIKYKGKYNYLGLYTTEEEAAAVYLEAFARIKEQHGSTGQPAEGIGTTGAGIYTGSIGEAYGEVGQEHSAAV